MKYTHPKLIIEQPAPGHYVIRGHNPASVQTDEGRVVPLDQCYITPEVPSEVLQAILADRNGQPPLTDPEVLVASDGDSGPSGTLDAILDVLEKGTSRIRDLADAVGCTVEDIKTLDGQGFTIGNGGWIKLITEEAES